LYAINPAFMVIGAVVIVAFSLFVISRLAGGRRPQTPTASDKVPITVLPKTSLGRWSLGLAIVSIVVFVVAAGPLHEQWGINENEELVNPVLTVVLTTVIVGTAAADLVSGLISVIKRKERSVLVFLGMLVTFWWAIVGALGEFVI
jgi:multisubunit Na+/H+ antiporter MnhC subunit